MSETQSTLEGSIARHVERRREREREWLADEGALYGRTRGARAVRDDTGHTEPGECRGCQRPLTVVCRTTAQARRIARLIGDNNGDIPACADCYDDRTPTEGNSVTSTMRAAMLARESYRNGW